MLLIVDDLKHPCEAMKQYFSYICGMKDNIYVFVHNYCWAR